MVVDEEFVYKLNKQTLKLSLKSRHFLTDVAYFTDVVYSTQPDSYSNFLSFLNSNERTPSERKVDSTICLLSQNFVLRVPLNFYNNSDTYIYKELKPELL